MKAQKEGNTEHINKRRCDIELIRFFAAVEIMVFHGNFYKVVYSSRLVPGGWIYVELFLMLTGFFTAYHFLNRSGSSNVNDPSSSVSQCSQDAKESIRYVLRKFRPIYFYFFLALSLTYIVLIITSGIEKGLNARQMLDYGCNYLQEALLLYGTGFCEAKMNTGWFVSAMFWTLPVITYLIHSKARGVFCYLLSGILPILYYSQRGVLMRQGGLDDIVRTAACLSLGVFAYITTEKIKQFCKDNAVVKHGKRMVMLLFSVIALFFIHHGQQYQFPESKTVLVLLFCILVLLFAGEDIFKKLKHRRIVYYLGEISLPIYLFQLVSGSIAKRMECANILKVSLYFMITIALAAGSHCIYAHIKRRGT